MPCNLWDTFAIMYIDIQKINVQLITKYGDKEAVCIENIHVPTSWQKQQVILYLYIGSDTQCHTIRSFMKQMQIDVVK